MKALSQNETLEVAGGGRMVSYWDPVGGWYMEWVEDESVANNASNSTSGSAASRREALSFDAAWESFRDCVDEI